MRTFVGVCLVSLLSMPAWGQQKPGTEYQTLPISPSVRADGMGGAGMTLLDDESVDINPGILGLLHADSRCNVSISPVGAGTFWYDQSTFNYLALSLGLLKGEFRPDRSYRLNIAYHMIRYKWEMLVTTYAGFDTVGETSTVHNLTLGGGITGSVEVSLGLNAKYFDEKVDDGSGDGYGLDMGCLVRIPDLRITDKNGESSSHVYLSPSAALAWKGLLGRVDLPAGSYPLKDFYLFGVSLEMGLRKETPDGERTPIRLLPAYKAVYDSRTDRGRNFGLEIQTMDALGIRGGWGRDYFPDYDTWGFSLMSRGIVRTIVDLSHADSGRSAGSFIGFLRDRLQVTFSFARQTAAPSPHINVDYYEITVAL